MASLLIPNISDDLHRRLKDRADANKRSPEEEAHDALVRAFDSHGELSTEHVVDAAQRLFGLDNGFHLDLPNRGGEPERVPPDFSRHYDE